MSEGVVLNPTRLVLAALIGLVILLVLIIKFNVQAMIRIIPRTGLLCASWFHSGKTVHVLTFLFSVFIRHVKPFSKFF